MLKRALTPRWLAGLLLATLVAGGFGFLANWQWSRSHEAPPPPESITEKVKPLSSVYKPGAPILQTQADHIVEAKGTFEESKQILVENRLQSGDRGYWVVAAFHVAGGDEWIPVVRGWTADPVIPGGLPSGVVTVQGRLLPPEAPLPDDKGAVEDGRVASLSPAELTNLWDVPAYDAFIVSNDKIPSTAPVEFERVVVGVQPQSPAVNWLNVFYAIEWIVFAAVAYYIWFQMLKREHEMETEAAALTRTETVTETDTDHRPKDPAS